VRCAIRREVFGQDREFPGVGGFPRDGPTTTSLRIVAISDAPAQGIEFDTEPPGQAYVNPIATGIPETSAVAR